MVGFHDMPREMRQALAASALLHLLLALLFLLATLGVDSTPLPFAEVAFVSGAPGSQAATASTDIRPAAAAAERVPDKPAPRSSARPEQKPRPRPAVASDKVQPRVTPRSEPVKSAPVAPPKRRMLEDEEPLLNRQEQGKITPGRAIEPAAGRPAAGLSRGETEGSSTAAPGPAGESATAATGTAGAGSGSPISGAAAAGGGAGQPFTIEGDAAQRLILKQVIPRYPDDLQQEAVLQFRFTVQPDGRLTGLIPMRQGDPTLEKITIAALRQWLFNARPATAEQKAVQGIITFRYQLE